MPQLPLLFKRPPALPGPPVELDQTPYPVEEFLRGLVAGPDWEAPAERSARDWGALAGTALSLAPIAKLLFHGSKHRFAPTAKNPLGEFDLRKIGTGEGAQAYGWGQYLAENPKVALYDGYAPPPRTVKKMVVPPEWEGQWEDYRVAATRLNQLRKDYKYHLDTSSKLYSDPEARENYLQYMRDQRKQRTTGLFDTILRGAREDAAYRLETEDIAKPARGLIDYNRLEPASKDPQAALDILRHDPLHFRESLTAYDELDRSLALGRTQQEFNSPEVRRMYQMLREIVEKKPKPIEVQKPGGYLYTVDAPDDVVKNMLPLDEPLPEDLATKILQSPIMNEALGGYLDYHDKMPTGRLVQSALADYLNIEQLPNPVGISSPILSRFLRRLGFPGAKFKDGLSRNWRQENPTYNHIFFDTKPLNIIRRQQRTKQGLIEE